MPTIALPSPPVPLTMVEKDTVEAALAAGKNGSATMVLLASALEIATRHHMLASVAQLRRYVYQLIPPPEIPLISGRMVVSSIFVGLVSGTVIAWIYSRTRIHDRLGIGKVPEV